MSAIQGWDISGLALTLSLEVTRTKRYPGDSFGQEASLKIRLYLRADPYTLLANPLSL